MNIFNVITGVSGSGKSSLVKQIIYPALKKVKGGMAQKTGDFQKLEGDIENIDEEFEVVPSMLKKSIFYLEDLDHKDKEALNTKTEVLLGQESLGPSKKDEIEIGTEFENKKTIKPIINISPTSSCFFLCSKEGCPLITILI